MAQKDFGGCIFCSEKGSGDHLLSIPIKEQIYNALHSIKIQRANSFILYFQNYSNTYKSIEELKKIYDKAINEFSLQSKEIVNTSLAPISQPKLVGIQIATRPDLITQDIAKLLSSYNDKLYVAVELGLQTVNDDSNFLNTFYTADDFKNAVNILNQYNIDIVAHIIVGLPKRTTEIIKIDSGGKVNSNDFKIFEDNVKEITTTKREEHEDIIKTVDFINLQNIQGIKIHSCYILKNTFLEKLYNDGLYTPISLEEYIDELTYILTHISPNVVIHRISGDAPKDLLVAPSWNLHKKLVLNRIYKLFSKENLSQGMYFNTNKGDQ